MKNRVHRPVFGIFICTFYLMLIFSGCTGTKAQKEVPWGINVPDLPVRLIIRETMIESGRYPLCTIEVMNASERVILVRRDFALNGPVVRDDTGLVMPQKKPAELTAEDMTYMRIGPGSTISVEVIPNYEMTKPGTYTLEFIMNPEWWGYEDENNNVQFYVPSQENGTVPASNEIKVTVYER